MSSAAIRSVRSSRYNTKQLHFTLTLTSIISTYLFVYTLLTSTHRDHFWNCSSYQTEKHRERLFHLLSLTFCQNETQEQQKT